MSYIVKAGPGCNGAACRLCEEYLEGFFSRNGGIAVTNLQEDADLAAQFCPQQCISVVEYREDSDG